MIFEVLFNPGHSMTVVFRKISYELYYFLDQKKKTSQLNYVQFDFYRTKPHPLVKDT